jgi:hypothetical protein
VAVVALASDKAEAMRQFVADSGWSFPVLLASDELTALYGVQAIPTQVLIDQQGRIAQTIVGGTTASNLSRLVDDLGD